MALAIAVVVLLAIGFLVWLRRDSGNAGAGVPQIADAPAPDLRWDSYDREFYGRFEEVLGPTVDHYFPTTVAGTKHANRDRTRRPPVIWKCEQFEILKIEPELDNPADPKAVAIRRQDGAQLGYVPARTAHEIYRDFSKPEFRWIGVFSHADRHPETGKVVGAVIVLARMNAELLKTAEPSPGQ